MTETFPKILEQSRSCTEDGKSTDSSNGCNKNKCCSGCCGSSASGNHIRRFCDATAC